MGCDRAEMTDHAMIPRVRQDRQRRAARGIRHAGYPLLTALLCLAALPASASRLVLTNGAYTPIRVGPSKAHPRLTELPEGVPLWAEDKVGGWYRLRLARDLPAYAHEVSVRALEPGAPPPPGRVALVTVAPSEAGVRIVLSLGRRVPFRVRQFVAPQRLCLDLFGAETADCRWRCLPIENFVGGMRLRRLAPDKTQLWIELAGAQQRGYEVSYPDDHSLALDIRRPYASAGLRGKMIVLDPGHGGRDEGAVGPSGLLEKDANLAIAREVKGLLVERGSRVALTRESDLPLTEPGSTARTELTARVIRSKSLHPDIFVSIHCNHPGSDNRPDVAGTETYYWSPMSAQPAYLIQSALCREVGTASRLVAPGPFRVLRETDAPRVLVECCYISSPAEEALLRDGEGRRRIAAGIVDGLCDYFRVAARPQGPTTHR